MHTPITVSASELRAIDTEEETRIYQESIDVIANMLARVQSRAQRARIAAERLDNRNRAVQCAALYSEVDKLMQLAEALRA